MLRVMLVDDEPLALEGLQLLINWRKEGFVVCAACDSGHMALEMFTSTKPDLIVTDINMRNMNGIQLMEALRNRGYNGAFLVVSGYSDFEYAQQAMRLSVAGYLLKPVDAKEASEVLELVRKQLIDKELKHHLPMAEYQQDISELLTGQNQKTDQLPQGTWRILTWGIPVPYDEANSILEKCSAAGVHATTHIIDGREWLVLFCLSGVNDALMQDIQKALLEMEREYIAGEEKQSAEQMLLEYWRICELLNNSDEELIQKVQALTRAVSLLQYDNFEIAASELNMFCQLRGNDLLAKAYDLFYHYCVRQLEKDPDKLSEMMRESGQNILRLGKTIMRLLTPVVNRISDQVKAYLPAHHLKRLTLENVAAALGYNATYLGRVFREETGIGFREYVSEYRLKKAAELMLTSTQPIHQIADRVGYTQYKLFLAHFKRMYGMTPVEYRQNVSP